MQGVRGIKGLQACQGTGRRAWIQGMWVDGICSETGWIDPVLWEKLSEQDKTRYYELVQAMLAEKAAGQQPQDGDQRDGDHRDGDGDQQGVTSTPRGAGSCDGYQHYGD